MKAETGKDIEKAKGLLESGQLVSIPTETVYGLAGNALHIESLISIYKVKKRPSFDPLIVHISSFDMIGKYVKSVPEIFYKLAEKFSPGPITYVLPKRDIIPDLVTSGYETVAIRIPNHPFTLELLSSLSFPLAAPSANLFGQISPTSPHHVFEQLGAFIPYILDGGICAIGLESTIVTVFDDKLKILRHGGISLENLQKVAGKDIIHSHENDLITVPGQLKSHYATRTQMLIGDIPTLIKKFAGHKLAVLSFKTHFNEISPDYQIVLSPSGNIDHAAQELFSAMHNLDRLNADFILTELFPEESLGIAINDRLKRASFRDYFSESL
ncbi:L-threonylcarbamoyladenylate synthase [Bacteroidota bacterium]